MSTRLLPQPLPALRFAESDSAGVFVAPDTENEQALQASVQAGADSVAVLVVPSNIEGELAITANNIVYSDIVFHDFKGNLNIFNGAVNLERMGARTDVGSVSLNALYSAPTKNDASFALRHACQRSPHSPVYRPCAVARLDNAPAF